MPEIAGYRPCSRHTVPTALHELRTAGAPVKIVLSSDRETLAPTWDEVALVRATIVDDQGVTVPRAKDLISFQATGAGVVAAVDNGENASHEPFMATQRLASGGHCVAYVKATAVSGKIILTATAPGLKSDTITMEVKK